MWNSKILTDELVAQRMEAKGWIEGCDEDHARKQVLEYYECELTDNWSNPDFSIYEESTADGYSVWIATENRSGGINVNDEVYYYDSELTDVLSRAIQDYDAVYCDDEDMQDTAITELYEELLERMDDVMRDELLDEGYTEKVTNPINSIQWIEMIAQDYQFNRMSDDYTGSLNVDTTEGYPYRKFSLEVRMDLRSFKIITDHYGLQVQRATAGEMIFVLLDTGEEIV